MFLCPRRLKVNKRKIQPLKTVATELSESKKKIIKFQVTCTNRKNVSTKKDVVETFTLQLFITLFPQSTDSYLYYQREPLSGDEFFSEWYRVDTFRR